METMSDMRSLQVNEFSLGMLALCCGLWACSGSADDCEQNGACVSGSMGSGGGGGMMDPECTTPDQCGIGDSCTTYACQSGVCLHFEEPDGTVVGNDACRSVVCAGGVESPGDPSPAGTLCGDSQVCDGGGYCVSCTEGADDNCPMGYSCAGGSCRLAVGEVCGGDTVACASGYCVDGHCCGLDCADVCRTCDPQSGYTTCALVQAHNVHPTCGEPGMACDGNGHCKGEAGTPCLVNADCVDGWCDNGHCHNAP